MPLPNLAMPCHTIPLVLPHPTYSVADTGNLSQIPDPDFYPSRISDPKTATKDRDEKFFCQTIFCSHKFHKTEYYFIFDMLKKKI
jgi:hypothetical protein